MKTYIVNLVAGSTPKDFRRAMPSPAFRKLSPRVLSTAFQGSATELAELVAARLPASTVHVYTYNPTELVNRVGPNL